MVGPPMTSHVDIFGQRYSVGDTVAFPQRTRKTSRPYLVVARVIVSGDTYIRVQPLFQTLGNDDDARRGYIDSDGNFRYQRIDVRHLQSVMKVTPIYNDVVEPWSQPQLKAVVS